VPALTASKLLLICRPATWQLLARIARLTAAARASDAVVLTDPAELAAGPLPDTAMVWAGKIADDTRASSLLDRAAGSLPLARGYFAVTARLNSQSGRVKAQKVPIFAPGDRPGKSVTLPLRKLPGTDGVAALAVLAEGDPDQVVTTAAVPLPAQLRYEVTIVLDGPGRLSFTDPAGVRPDDRPWHQTLASLPSKVSVPDGPIDLVCAIELGGTPEEVRTRKELVAGLLSIIEAEYPSPELVMVSVIGCVDHVFRPGFQHTPVVRGQGLAPIAEAR